VADGDSILRGGALDSALASGETALGGCTEGGAILSGGALFKAAAPVRPLRYSCVREFELGLSQTQPRGQREEERILSCYRPRLFGFD
jgi:hypothetical protein